MSVHVVIKRKFKMNQPDTLIPLLHELQVRAALQKGYQSTDILQSTENPEDFLVISKWDTEESWQAWYTSTERRELQGQVDSLIGERTFYEIFKALA